MKKLAMLLVGLLLLAACRGGSDKTTPSASSAAATTAGEATMVTSATPATTATNRVAATPTHDATAAPSAVAATPPTTTEAATPATAATAEATTAPTGEPAETAASIAPIFTPGATATTAPPATATEQANAAPTAAPTQAAPVGQFTQDQLAGALLSASDLPDGWEEAPPDPRGDAEPVGFCQPDAASGIEQVRANGAYQQTDKALFLQETLIGFAPGDSVAWMNWVQPTLDCTQVTDDTVSPEVVYEVAPLNLSVTGDQVLAYRLSVSDPSFGEVAYDIVYARVGNCVAAIANFALGAATNDVIQTAAQAAVDRARPVCG